MKKPRERKDIWGVDGFSLIEILVVVSIMAILVALVAPRVINLISPTKQKAAKAQISNLGTALDMFRLDVGRYPTTSEGLEALRVAPGNADSWNGPYLSKEVPKDPWKNDYFYVSPGQYGEYDLASHGADGSEGGEGENEDVVSWK
jgi:general secretion pathway protein G